MATVAFRRLEQFSSLIMVAIVTLVFIVFFASSSLAQESRIVVGPNVQVSKSADNELHYEVMLAADPGKNGTLLGGSYISSEANNFTSVAYVSLDGGRQWVPALRLGKPAEDLNYSDPATAIGPDGTLYFVCNVHTPEPNHRAYAKLYSSKDGGKTWSAVNTEFPFFDRPYVTVDDTDSPTRGTIYVVGKTPNFAAGVVEDRVRAFPSVASSSDGGKTFKYSRFVLPAVLHTPAVVLSDGTVVFLFSENLGAANEPSQGVSNTLLKVITSSDGAETFSKPVVITRYSQTPAYRMWTSSPAVYLAGDRTSGPFKDRLYAVYAGFDGSYGRPSRSQIALVYSSDKGRTWSDPTVIAEHGPGKAVTRISFMPVVSVNSKGIVGVSWYDRSESENGLDFTVRFAASLDGGETFLPSVKVSDKAFTHTDNGQWVLGGFSSGGGHKSPWVPTFGGGPLKVNLRESAISHHYGGQTAGLSADGAGSFHPFWIDNRTGTPQVWTASIKVNGIPIRNGSAELSDLADVSERLVLRVENPHYDRANKKLSFDLRIQNVSTDTVYDLLKAKVLSLGSEGNARLLTTDNGIAGIGAVIDFSGLLERGELKPLQISKVSKRVELSVSDWPSLTERLTTGAYGLQILDLKLRMFGRVGRRTS